jgi:hypothetical protein
MFQGRCVSSKIGGQGQKNVSSGTVSPHFTKLFLIFYGLIKITSGCHTLESVPEKKIVEIQTVYAPDFNQTQCYNMPSGHQFALKISAFPPRINMNLNDTVLLSVLEEYHHYAYLFHKELQEEVKRKNFILNKRTQILLATIIKENNRKLLLTLFPYLVLLTLAGKLFGYKTVLLIIFATNLIQQTQAETTPTTLQSLHNTLLYIRFRIHHNWLGSGFGVKQYQEMEAGLVDAIIQLQQLATPPPPKPTSASKIPIFQSNNERIHGIIHSFVNKTLNKQAEEREEAPNASGLTKQQEMVYATE